MDLKRLEYFCAIIEKGQISKAAQSLHISQPPLSMRLKELEDELGVTLIHRQGKAWQVTPEGRMLYRKAQFILSYMEGVKNDIASIAGELHGRIKLGVCPPCRQMAAHVISDLGKSHPRLQFRVWIMDNQSLERHLQESHLDFALVLLPVKGRNYAIRSLQAKPYYAVFGKGMPRPRAGIIGVEDLAGLPLIVQHRRDSAGINAVLMKAFQRQNRQAHVVLETQDSSFLQALLQEGFPAVAILNEYELERLPPNEFPAARLDVADLTLAPALISLEKAYTSLLAQKVMDCFAARF